MALAKQLHPVQSNKLYSEKSKEMLKDVNIPPGMIEKCFQLFQTCFVSKQKHSCRVNGFEKYYAFDFCVEQCLASEVR